MSILDFANNGSSSSNNNTGRQARNEDRAPSQFWLNIGYEAAGKFVSLPKGLPLDDMQAQALRGNNDEWLKYTASRNDLLKAIQEKAATMAPGEEHVINLQVRLRRTDAAKEVAPTDNEFSLTTPLFG